MIRHSQPILTTDELHYLVDIFGCSSELLPVGSKHPAAIALRALVQADDLKKRAPSKALYGIYEAIRTDQDIPPWKEYFNQEIYFRRTKEVDVFRHKLSRWGSLEVEDLYEELLISHPLRESIQETSMEKKQIYIAEAVCKFREEKYYEDQIRSAYGHRVIDAMRSFMKAMDQDLYRYWMFTDGLVDRYACDNAKRLEEILDGDLEAIEKVIQNKNKKIKFKGKVDDFSDPIRLYFRLTDL